MHSDPHVNKIWQTWIDLHNTVPFWDPWGAAITLFLSGMVAGYGTYKAIYE